MTREDILNIPDENDWGQKEGNLDFKWAKKNFFGRSISGAKSRFHRNIIESCSELRYMSRKPFQYYIFSLVEFIKDDNFDQFDSADVASCFLSLIKEKLEAEPDDILPIYNELLPTIKSVAKNQQHYNAPLDIYGDFTSTFSEIENLAKG